ncbi:MAG: glycosyltransferase family 2 protein [Lachnospiraceae bacterium]|nr:glycosyltransferase family 2 protein [Lachnospiraceae bacterium]
MVSVIIPVYRSEQTLERCINSIREQTYRDWEAVMIVNGPPDASGILADRLAEQDERIQVIHQSDQGVSAARNTGIHRATGQFIAFLDSDDYLVEDALHSMMEAMIQGKSDMVIAGFHHLYFGRDILKIPPMAGTFPLQTSEETFLTLYGTQFLNMPWNKLYKKEFICQGFPENLTLGEDLCFNLSYMEQIRSYTVLQQPVCNYIQDDRGTTLSTKRREDRMETATVLYDRVMTFCDKIFKGQETSRNRVRILNSKIAVEYLDAMENLPLELPRNTQGRRKEIQNYYQAWQELQEAYPCEPQLALLDYKMIYGCFRHGWIGVTDLMILLRSLVVKLLRRS